MDALKVLLERRSIRKYRAVNVSDEVLQEIVEAGLYAPSGICSPGILWWCARRRK